MKHYREFILYITIGVATFLTEYCSFLILYHYIFLENNGKILIIAQYISFCLAVIVNFIGNKKITFANKDGHILKMKKQFTYYILLAFINLVISTYIIYILVIKFGIVVWLAKLIVIGLITSWTYILYKKVIFRVYLK